MKAVIQWVLLLLSNFFVSLSLPFFLLSYSSSSSSPFFLLSPPLPILFFFFFFFFFFSFFFFFFLFYYFFFLSFSTTSSSSSSSSSSSCSFSSLFALDRAQWIALGMTPRWTRGFESQSRRLSVLSTSHFKIGLFARHEWLLSTVACSTRAHTLSLSLSCAHTNTLSLSLSLLCSPIYFWQINSNRICADSVLQTCCRSCCTHPPLTPLPPACQIQRRYTIWCCQSCHTTRDRSTPTCWSTHWQNKGIVKKPCTKPLNAN